MKILPISDIHLEFGGTADELVETLADADVCVIAGDFTMARFLDTLRADLKPFSEKYDQVIYVAGNHEYYKGEVEEVSKMLAVACQEYSNVHLLRPDHPLVYKDQRFIGGTMWFPQGPNTWLGPKLLNDYRMIKNFTPWVYDQNTLFRAMLKEELTSTDIVVTHHLPSMNSVAPQYQREVSNIFFVSNQAMDINYRQPKLWIHGHTHEACDYKLGDTRVICNPKGYPYEGKPFNPKLIVEV